MNTTWVKSTDALPEINRPVLVIKYSIKEQYPYAIAEFEGMKQRTVYSCKRGEYIEDYPSWFYCGTGGYSDCNPFAWTYLPDYNELFEIFK